MITRVFGGRSACLRNSLESLRASGLFADPRFCFTLVNTPDSAVSDGVDHLDFLRSFPGPVRIVEAPKRCHYNRALVVALREASRRPCDAVLFMEDDIVVCDRFPQRVTEFVARHWTQAVMWDFATFYREILECLDRGEDYWDCPVENFWGNQCFAMRRDAAISYARFVDVNTDSIPGYADILYRHWMPSSFGVDVVRCAVPSLAQHTGIESTAGHEFVTVPCFAGEVESRPREQRRPRQTRRWPGIGASGRLRFVVDPEHGEAIELNESAAAIYRFCNGSRRVRDIIDAFAGQFPGHEENITAHVHETLARLEEFGLVRLH